MPAYYAPMFDRITRTNLTLIFLNVGIFLVQLWVPDYQQLKFALMPVLFERPVMGILRAQDLTALGALALEVCNTIFTHILRGV